MITKEEIEHVARLARIEFSEKELERFEKDLVEILEFVNRLNEVDTSGVKPVAGGLASGGPVTLDSATRSDDIHPPLGNPGELVNAAAEKENGWVEVKAVF